MVKFFDLTSGTKNPKYATAQKLLLLLVPYRIYVTNKQSCDYKSRLVERKNGNFKCIKLRVTI